MYREGLWVSIESRDIFLDYLFSVMHRVTRKKYYQSYSDAKILPS